MTTGSGGDRCHSGGFLLRIMPPSWHPVPACAPRLCCGRAIPHFSGDGAASIRKSGLEIKNRCTKEGENGENRASIPKSEPEIKNRCTKEGVNGENRAAIPKSGLEIKNHCSTRAKSREKFAAIPNSDSRIKNRCSKGRQNSHRLKGHQNILQPKTISPRPSAQTIKVHPGTGRAYPRPG